MMIYKKEEYVQDDADDSEFPVKQVDCLTDLAEGAKRFIGRTTLNMQTPVGVQQLPISFEIEADSVEQAFGLYAETARPKIEELRRHLQERITELQRQEQTRIVTPGASGALPAGGVIRLDDLRGRD